MQLCVVSRHSGFTLVEIMIVVAIIGLLASIAIPNFVKARENAQRTTCIANLRSIDGVKSIWAFEAHHKSTDTPTEADLFGPTAYMRDKPQCPANGTYSLNQVDTKPSCSVPLHSF